MTALGGILLLAFGFLLVTALGGGGWSPGGAPTPDHPEPPTAAPDPTGGPDTTTGSYAELSEHVLLTTDGLGLPDMGCDLAPFGTSQPEIEAHWHSAIDCLDDLWEPVLAGAGIAHQPPQVSVPEEASSATSPCTDSGVDFAAFYCPVNQTIYLPMDTMELDAGAEPEIYLYIVAHEYGHHVQALASILEADHRERVAVGHDTDAGMEVSRRTELQAECFSGMYLGAQTASGVLGLDAGYDQFVSALSQAGPSETHGDGANRAAWVDAGYTANLTTACNTYAADSADVA